MLKFFIKTCLLILFVNVSAQQKNDSIPKDSIVYKTNYGLRLGIDISKPIRSILQDYNSGLEIIGDYRISKKWYAAAELGNEKFTTNEDFTNSKGNFEFVYNTSKYGIPCERRFEINSDKIVIGFVSNGCF